MKKRYIIYFILLLGFNFVAQENTTMQLSLKNLIKEGISNNFDIKLQKTAIENSKGKVLRNKGRFDPFFHYSLNTNTGNDPTVSYKDMFDFNTEFVLPTNYGLSLNSGLNLSRTNVINPQSINNSEGVWLGLDLPLFKGLGENNANNANLKASELQYNAEKKDYAYRISQLIKFISESYLVAYSNTNVYNFYKKISEYVEKYKHDIATLVDKDQLPKSQMLRTNAYYNSIKIEMTNAEKSLHNSLYNLNQILGIVRHTDNKTIPTFLDKYPDFDKLNFTNYFQFINTNIDSLIKNRKDYQSLAMNVSATGLEVKGASNDLKEDINLNLQYNYYGLKQNEDWNKLLSAIDGHFPGSSFTLSLSYMLPFQKAVYEGIYISKKSELESQNISLNKFAFDVKNNVKNIISGINDALGMYNNQKENVKLYEQVYYNEYEKFKMGLATQIDVTNSHQDYIKANITYENLKVQIAIDLVNLKYQIGQLPSEPDGINNFDLWKINY